MRRVLADQKDYGMSVDELIEITAEYRAELRATARGRKKTKWFSPTDPKPTLPGIYEVRVPKGVRSRVPNGVRAFARWRDGYWTSAFTSMEIEETRGPGSQKKYWRGLARDPKKGKQS